MLGDPQSGVTESFTEPRELDCTLERSGRRRPLADGNEFENGKGWAQKFGVAHSS